MSNRTGAQHTTAFTSLLFCVLALLAAALLAIAVVNHNGALFAHAADLQVVSKSADETEEQVLIAKRKIGMGEPLSPEMFRSETRVRAQISDDMVREFAEIEEHYSNADVKPGEAFSIDYVSFHRPIRAVSRYIPEGYRAINSRLIQSEPVYPGARVSLLLTTKGGEQVSLASNVEVYSAEQIGRTQVSAILFVEAKLANKILLAQSLGKLSVEVED